jgi:3-hydroxyacyl-CoA dehydrogenase
MGIGISRLLGNYTFSVNVFSARELMAGQLPDLDNVKNAELIIEAISENLNHKLELLKLLSEVNRNGTIATTTSSLSVANLSESIDDPT